MASVDERIHAAAASVFGIQKLKVSQLDALRAALGSKDVVVIMPTGSGKSLCFQLSAVIENGVTIVVSPLLALMKDQVQYLHSVGVKAMCYTGHGCITVHSSPEEAYILYTTPECLTSSQSLWDWMDVQHSMGRLRRFVLDEAHCVHTWGKDFRPCYRDVASRRQYYTGVPYMALTATATLEIIDDIVSVMESHVNEQGVLVIQPPCFRGNLQLCVACKPRGSQAYAELFRFLQQQAVIGNSGIVYVQARSVTVELATQLVGDGIVAHAFHAQLSQEHKDKVLSWWQQCNVGVVVATVAFGMGIHRPDVRFVVHWSTPRCLLSYFQEVGRAGRDGKPAQCILYYNSVDVAKMRKAMYRGRACSADKTAFFDMCEWCLNNRMCRHLTLLRHFGVSSKVECKEMCDVCKI